MKIYKADLDINKFEIHKLMTFGSKVATPLSVELMKLPAGTFLPENGVTLQRDPQLLYIAEGETETYTDSETFRAVKGNLIVISPGESHHSKAITDSVILSMLCEP